MSDLELEAALLDAMRAESTDVQMLSAELDRRESFYREREAAAAAELARVADRLRYERSLDQNPLTSPARRVATGMPTVAQLRREYDDHVYISYLQAEADCNGHLLNSRGRAERVNPETLFRGNDKRALAYASDELKQWWGRNGRLSFAAWRFHATGDRRFAHSQYVQTRNEVAADAAA